MPEFSGLSHVSLSVRDRDASRDWYHDVLGFEQIEESRTDAYDEWIMLHPSNRMVLCLQQHKTNRGEEFDPTRTGGDHVGLKVDSRAELDAWAAWFADKRVTHSPTVDAPYGSVLTFKDPDRFQLELFYRANHP
jgi:catechol 2,3-dioxygenase-like lactoylglutathione lyase family enzyme